VSNRTPIVTWTKVVMLAEGLSEPEQPLPREPTTDGLEQLGLNRIDPIALEHLRCVHDGCHKLS
jgi:hypothetical protein